MGEIDSHIYRVYILPFWSSESHNFDTLITEFKCSARLSTIGTIHRYSVRDQFIMRDITVVWSVWILRWWPRIGSTASSNFRPGSTLMVWPLPLYNIPFHLPVHRKIGWTLKSYSYLLWLSKFSYWHNYWYLFNYPGCRTYIRYLEEVELASLMLGYDVGCDMSRLFIYSKRAKTHGIGEVAGKSETKMDARGNCAYLFVLPNQNARVQRSAIIPGIQALLAGSDMALIQEDRVDDKAYNLNANKEPSALFSFTCHRLFTHTEWAMILQRSWE